MKVRSVEHKTPSKPISQELSPFWRAARNGAIAVTITMFAAGGWFFDTGLGNLVEALLGAVFGGLALIVFTHAAKGIGWLLGRFPRQVAIALGGIVGAVIFLRETEFLRRLPRAILDPSQIALPLPNALSTLGLLGMVLASAALIGVAVMWQKGRTGWTPKGWLAGLFVLCLALDIVLVTSLASDGSDPYPTDFKTLTSSLSKPLDLANPAQPGAFDVETLSYGSGVNARRPEYGGKADLVSRSVDGSKLLPEWKDSKKRLREWYWGFGLDKAPLNGRVWTPTGDGPFPLVMIVHGNHTMEEYSEAGYAYLGELLASRGFITVSLDQNYINATWSGDFRGKEMPARAWLLLEHLRLWRDWNNDADHHFGGKVNMDEIALIGHSRGGEAAAIAASYNTLPFFPDDATLKFDYNFSIKAIVTIAQIDRRYRRRSKLKNVNFLALHGSYDSDESAFHGLRQFNRVRFTDGNYWFKAGVYIHGANHGQFNTGWGREDSGPPNSWLLNLAPIIPGEDQRQVAKVYISAFLEATLKKDRRYLPLFQDVRVGAEWLPDQIYVSQFTDSQFEPIATFEEDLDVTTGTAKGIRISTEGLTLWREEGLRHRDKLGQGTNVVVLGWNSEGANSNAGYTIALPDDFGSNGLFSTDNVLTFALSGSTEKPPVAEDEDPEDTDESDGDEDDADPESPSFSIEVLDDQGATARIVYEEDSAMTPPLRVQLMKGKRLNKRLYNDTWEPILQTCEISLARFTDANAELDLSRIREIRFRFDRSPRGVVILDNVGIRRATP